MRTSLKFMAAAVALGASVLGSEAANANPIQMLYSIDGGGSYVQFGSITTNGINGGNTTVGNYSIQASATGSPVLAAPNFQTTTLDVSSSGAGTLIVAVVEGGLTTPGLTGFSLGFTNNALSNVSVTDTFAVINSGGTYTALASATLAPGSSPPASFVPYTSAPNYSVVELYTVTFGAAGGIVNATIAESGVFSVPEPVSMSLLGASLVGLGLVRMRRKSV